MTRLLLSGGGGAEDSLLLDQLFVRLITTQHMFYLPNAMDPHRRPYEACYQWVQAVFTPLGLDHISMWSDLSTKTVDDLQPFDAVYIGGGNTFKLLYDIKQARFDQALQHFLADGGIIYGGSAGAIICGRDIAPASLLDPNDVGLEDTSGLDLLQGASVWCHYALKDEQHIQLLVARLQHPIIALSERSGLYVQDKLIMVVGFEPVIVFQQTGRSVFPPSSVVVFG